VKEGVSEEEEAGDEVSVIEDSSVEDVGGKLIEE
jgi:hypothetical protein